MPRLSVQERRKAFERGEESANGVWICEACGETWEEELVVYEIKRITRAFPDDRCACLCSRCADIVPHGRVLSS